MAVKTTLEYLMWDGRPKLPFATPLPFVPTVTEGAEAFKARFGHYPNLCLVSVSDGAEVARLNQVIRIGRPLGGAAIRLEVRQNIRPHNYWLGRIEGSSE